MVELLGKEKALKRIRNAEERWKKTT